ncbi:SDR family NAD(P)-dependent oxidoreductase [Paeniglutamicibacter psychrophenolicus]|uniref:SDR family NAD(P)-dependent oxidoreductase n=1 Tax=Paeniglutamicibacter psychrophenolicus TaxID=257454 RepID=UPI00278256F0|nr:SDR family NAD(P)-dependent oxidoreductase [Paeniglutamicibacter psychrophenolicus]MDQ0094165.1 short-subunit dehydrogenase [Paeniglutamicibacter psychrophenolicus]
MGDFLPPETRNPHRTPGTALVTGATSGLGTEFCAQLAARGHDLVVTARDGQRLAELAARLHAQFAVNVEVLAADLVTDEGTERVSARLAQTARPVNLLVNNAGYGLRGNFADNDLGEELDHLRIHTQAPLVLMHAALNAMGSGDGGRIINVASVAAFTPRGSYSAAKALIVNFSRWANVFYAGRGISVTAVCPGFVRTEFHDRMGADKTKIPARGWLDAPNVVRQALADSDAGKSVSIPSVRYKLATALARIAPDALVERLARRGR